VCARVRVYACVRSHTCIIIYSNILYFLAVHEVHDLIVTELCDTSVLLLYSNIKNCVII
jgi:hypothetical protein